MMLQIHVNVFDTVQILVGFLQYNGGKLEQAKDFSFITRLGISVTTQGGSGRQYVTGPGRTISKYRLVLLNAYRFRES